MADQLRHPADRRLRRRGPGEGRLDRHLQAHPRPDGRRCSSDGAPRARRPAGDARRPTRTATTRRWRRSGPGSTPIVARPGHRRGAEAVVPPAVQAAVLPRRVPAGLQPSPNVHLVDTDGKGVERIDETGVWVGGVHYELDCLIFASGFEVGTDVRPPRRVRDLRPRRRRRSPTTGPTACAAMHGMHVHGFPNLFIVGSEPGREPHLEHHPQPHRGRRDHRRRSSRHALEVGADEVEVTDRGRGRVGRRCWRAAPRAFIGNPDCTPGYYNNEGRPIGRRENASTAAATPTARSPTSSTSTAGAPRASSPACSSTDPSPGLVSNRVMRRPVESRHRVFERGLTAYVPPMLGLPNGQW